MSEQFELSPEEKQEQALSEKAFEEAQYKLALAYGEVFRSPAGQFVLKDLRERCNVNNSCVRADERGKTDHPDPNAVLVQEGKRCVYLHINKYIEADNERKQLG